MAACFAPVTNPVIGNTQQYSVDSLGPDQDQDAFQYCHKNKNKRRAGRYPSDARQGSNEHYTYPDRAVEYIKNGIIQVEL
jgi:hypothetical protein